MERNKFRICVEVQTFSVKNDTRILLTQVRLNIQGFLRNIKSSSNAIVMD